MSARKKTIGDGNGRGAKNLVIVESPAKARAIGKYLGRDFAVEASVGHVRDLPKKGLGVDPEKGFEPTYTVIHGKKKVLKQIGRAAKGAERIYVATDPDREGEAIAWHVVDELGIEPERIHRALFYEITPSAVRAAIENPGRIDHRKVSAQQARRILDRLVGFRISPLLTEPFYPGLSAGRVQTVALRIVCEREDEIDAFQQVPYWKVTAALEAPDGGEDARFEAELRRAGGVPIVPRGQPDEEGFRPPALTTEEAADRVVERGRAAEWTVDSVERKERRSTPSPPFTTSTLQQEASRRLRFSARRTMSLAQRLYEGVEIDGEPVGLITYMRTDSTRVGQAALSEVRSTISKRYGDRFLPEKPNYYRSRGEAQEAHEAIRPTSAARSHQKIQAALRRFDNGHDLWRLYQLVWLRFAASQMKPAVFDRTTIDFVTDRDLEFRASGSVMKFAGWIEAYAKEGMKGVVSDDTLLPALEDGDAVDLLDVAHEGKETQPPRRYSEATLVKELEKQGIGRPSTYADIISKLFRRNYTEREGRQIKPTVLGRFVLRYLVHHFDDIFEVGFTREMEEELDRVEEGELEWRQVVEEMWGPLSEDVRRIESAGDGDVEAAEWFELDPPVCPRDESHGRMGLRWNRFGPFWGCTEYPDCRGTQPIPELGPDPPDEPCPKCGGELVIKRGRRGPFVGCDEYPECNFTMNVGEKPQAAFAERERAREQEETLDRECPRCDEGKLTVKSGRFGPFIGCSTYPKCRYTEPLPTGVTCPECGEGDLVERRTGKGRKGRRFYGCSRYPDCDYTQNGAPRIAECPECGHAVAEVVRSEGEEDRLRCPTCKADVSEPVSVGGESD